jgi:glucose dehydrogenase
VHAGQGRKGANLWTDCIVAIDPDNGRLVWYFQTTPHDTHDWDGVQTPILFDGMFHGRKRKMVGQANRNGYFFLLDRANGEHLLTAAFADGTNWAVGIDSHGVPIEDPTKEPTRDGTLVSPTSAGASNWYPPSFNPQTGLFYVNTNRSYSVFYLTAEGKAEGYAGRDDHIEEGNGMIRAIDYQTGKIRWSHDLYGPFYNIGMLNTAGKLLFTGDTSRHVMALDPATGETVWHLTIAENFKNAITYQLDGRQFVLVTAGDSLYAFALPLK